jgi:hypothetical protein
VTTFPCHGHDVTVIFVRREHYKDNDMKLGSGVNAGVTTSIAWQVPGSNPGGSTGPVAQGKSSVSLSLVTPDNGKVTVTNVQYVLGECLRDYIGTDVPGFDSRLVHRACSSMAEQSSVSRKPCHPGQRMVHGCGEC